EAKTGAPKFSVGDPTFSPDARYAAYTRLAEPDSPNNDIVVLDMKTGEEKRLEIHPAKKEILGWASDGRRLLFRLERQGTWDAWLIRVVDGQATGSPRFLRGDIGG